jgi:hypothetical protein
MRFALVMAVCSASFRRERATIAGAESERRGRPA